MAKKKDDILTITLEFDDGNVVCEPLFVFEYDGTDYVALIPADEESDDVYIYQYHELSAEEFEFIDIDDDALFDEVVAEFERIMDEAEALED